MERKILEPIQVGNMTLKNRIMFPPLTTGYEERDGSIGRAALDFMSVLPRAGLPILLLAMWRQSARHRRRQCFMMTARFPHLRNWQMYCTHMAANLHCKSSTQSMMCLALES